MTIGITAVELEKEFLKWWKSDESSGWYAAQEVYEMVSYPTAKALFFEGWVRAEKYFEQQKENNEKGQK